MSELRTNRIVPRDGLPSGSSGGIIQIKYAIKNDTQSIASQGSPYTWVVDITGLSVSITPTRSDSKFLVQMHIGCHGTTGNAANYSDDVVSIAGGTVGDLAGTVTNSQKLTISAGGANTEALGQITTTLIVD